MDWDEVESEEPLVADGPMVDEELGGDLDKFEHASRICFIPLTMYPPAPWRKLHSVYLEPLCYPHSRTESAAVRQVLMHKSCRFGPR